MMNHFAKEEGLPLEEKLRLYAGRLQLWRLCCSASCRRARSCRGGPQRCAARFADWAEEVRLAATMQLNARDPERRAQIADLEAKIRRLSRSMTKGA